jgi:photosystem II stability/assembly factor-like uncharacterized protein
MSDRMFVATRKGLFILSRRAAGWSITGTAFLGDNVTLVMHDHRDGRVYAALDHGHFGVKLHRSTDGGKTFTECGVPVYPPLPEGAEPEKTPDGKIMPQTLKLVWALEPGGPDEPSVLWCGAAPAALFRSEDGGDTWQRNAALWNEPKRKAWFGGGYEWPAIHSVCVDPRDSRHVAVGISCGGVWETTDGGQSWAVRSHGMFAAYMPPDQAEDPAIQDPHAVVQCRSNPEWMWAQHHNGVFVTDNGGERWRAVKNIKPSDFGFAVAVHPSDPKTAWLVPAIKDEKRIPVDGRVVVTRTSDGGRTFKTLTRGLPQTHAYDLVFRHAMDIDETGRRLAFGSTTGSLWVTENGGDKWITLSTHLPPVHAVRFAKNWKAKPARAKAKAGKAKPAARAKAAPAKAAKRNPVAAKRKAVRKAARARG